MNRIIAGQHRGRRLETPSGDRTRPTTDRVREALFSAIATWAAVADLPVEVSLAGMSFADLYAGSGAVGLEAASRGADQVAFVEADARTVQLLQRNVRTLSADGPSHGCTVTTGSVATVLRRSPPGPPFDLVFADPPYGLSGEAVTADLAALVEHGWVGSGSLVVVERSRRTPEPSWPDGFRTWRKDYGETVLLYGALEQPSTCEQGEP